MSGDHGDDRDRKNEDLLHKRWTLNFLIQGAATHAHLTATHLVRDELESIRPGLTEQYDRFVLRGQWNYVAGDLMLLQGRPNRWFGWSKKPQGPIANHPVLARHANNLASVEADRIRQSTRAKGIRPILFISPIRLMSEAKELMAFEKQHRRRLEKIAIDVAHQIWGVDPTLLHATLTENVAFGDLHQVESFRGEVYRKGAAGYGGVLRHNGHWRVVAKAWVFPLLIHELVKGTAELICLHGMHGWDEQAYRTVTQDADRIEYEVWCIQAGGELWRRLLAARPRNVPLARVLMRIARLPPDPLHELINTIIVEPELATERLAALENESDHSAP